MNPFENRTHALSGPATDARPVAPDDAVDLPFVAIGLYVETGSTVRVTDTTATGFHALVLA